MNINSTLILQAIVFAILVWFTMTKVWPPIAKALDDRAQKIAEGLAAADRAKAELVQVNAQVEQELASSRNDVAIRLADAERRAQAIIDEAKRKASVDAARIVEQAHAEALQQAIKVRESLRDEVAHLAVKGAEQILRREVNATAHIELLNRLKAEL